MQGLRHTSRLFSIAITLARHDALFIFDTLPVAPLARAFGSLFRRRLANKTQGECLASALEALGPAFIKLGQAMSTRSDLIGEPMAEALSRLRDNLPPFSTQIAIRTIEEEFEATLPTIFSTFDEKPIAAASIAQVHKATTHDGRTVAVKILRPDIADAFARDLDLFFWLAQLVEKTLPSLRRLKPIEAVRTFKESVFFELDLRFEAAAAAEMADNIKTHEPGLHVPAVDWNLTSRRVLTMQWVEGIPFSNIEAIRASGFSAEEILTKASRSLFSQVFKDGFFHADLHPGNLFLDKNGDLVAVDFGIMGRLSIESRIYIAEILRGFLTGDYKRVAQVHFDAGYVPANKSLEGFTQACMAVARPITGKPLNEISIAKLLGQMFAIAAEFEMEVQPQLLLMQKTLMVAEGVGRMLSPNLNMWQLATPLIDDWASEHFGMKAKAKEAGRHAQEIVRKLPYVLSQAERTLTMLGDAQGIKLHPQVLAELHSQRKEQQQAWLVLGWSALAIFTLLAALYLG